MLQGIAQKSKDNSTNPTKTRGVAHVDVDTHVPNLERTSRY